MGLWLSIGLGAGVVLGAYCDVISMSGVAHGVYSALVRYGVCWDGYCIYLLVG